LRQTDSTALPVFHDDLSVFSAKEYFALHQLAQPISVLPGFLLFRFKKNILLFE
jgi:hypothetical protein